MGLEAIKLIDEGKYDEAILLLDNAQKLAPESIEYPYEIAYVYFMKGDYNEAMQFLEPLLEHPEVNDKIYQLLGKTYSQLEDFEKETLIYEAGLKIFPNSGTLCLESGITQMMKKDFDKAIYFFERGIKVEPQLISNYYWATRIFCKSSEKVWGLIYGEIFLNIERNSDRTREISKLLYETYINGVEVGENGFSLNYSRGATYKFDSIPDNAIPLYFGTEIYTPLLFRCLENDPVIDIHALNKIRTCFIKSYFQKYGQTLPNPLFEYQEKLRVEGHLEAYNYWVLSGGDNQGFYDWYQNNNDKWGDFLKWFTTPENVIGINKDSYFIRENQIYK